MIYFILFFVSMGAFVSLLGLLSTFIASLFEWSSITNFIVQFVGMAFLFSIYLIVLEKGFLKLYKDMKLTIKQLNVKEKVMQKISLFILMNIHYYALVWLEPKISDFFYFIVLALFLSFFLGVAIKGMFDETYQIKMTKESKKMIYEG